MSRREKNIIGLKNTNYHRMTINKVFNASAVVNNDRQTDQPRIW